MTARTLPIAVAIAIAAAIAWCVTGCGGPSRPVAGAPAVSPGEADTAAAKMFPLRCTPCHGPAGKGDGPSAPGLTPKPRDFSRAEWQATITDRQIETAILYGGAAIGRSPVMPANPDLAGRPEVIRGLRRLVRRFRAPAP